MNIVDTEFVLLDETDVAHMTSRTEKPDADCEIILKRQKWNHDNPLGTRIKHPKPTKKTVSTHWFFAS